MTEAKYIVAYNPEDPRPKEYSKLDIFIGHRHYYIAGSVPMISRHTLGSLSDHVRVLSEYDLQELESIDVQIEALQKIRSEFLVWCFKNAKRPDESEMRESVRNA